MVLSICGPGAPAGTGSGRRRESGGDDHSSSMKWLPRTGEHHGHAFTAFSGASRSRITSAAASARIRISSMRSAGPIWVRRASAVAAGSSRRTGRVRGRQPIADRPDCRPSRTSACGLPVSWALRPNVAGGASEASGLSGAGVGRAVRAATTSPAKDRGHTPGCCRNRRLIAKRYMMSLTVTPDDLLCKHQLGYLGVKIDFAVSGQ